MADSRQLHELIRPAVEALGLELVGVEFRPQGGRGGLLRVYIDGANGITVDDCADVSYQVSGLLDVEDPIPGEYTLEVSSPGLDRPLFSAADFQRFSGHRASIRMQRPVDGRRRFSGELRGFRDGRIVLVLDADEGGAEVELPLVEVDRARLVPQW